MKNIFSSPTLTPDLQKFIQVSLNLILTENRAQRHDLFVLTKMVRELLNSTKLQRQVDDYFESDGRTPPGVSLPLEDNVKDIPEDIQ